MNDRKLRTIAVLSLVTGSAILLIILIMYWLNLPGTVTIPIMMAYLLIQYRLSAPLFQVIYCSKIIDLPAFLQSKFPPADFRSQDKPCDVLLLRPPSAVLSAPDCGEALGLGYLAGVLRAKGVRITVIDSRLQGLDVMQTVELIMAYEPPAIGINLNFQYLAPVTSDLLKALRSRNFRGHITLGGLYASVAAEFLMNKMPEVNTIVCFEGEDTYLELVNNLTKPERWQHIFGLVYRGQDNAIKVNPLRSLIPDLNTLPHPARDYLNLAIDRGGYAYIASSRGCRGSCTYCVQQRSVSDPQGGRWRGRDPKDVVDEIEEFIKLTGSKLISFIDDDLFGPVLKGKGATNAEKIAHEIIARKLDINILISVQPRDVEPEIFSLLKQAGLCGVILAVDNFSQPVLNRYKKYSNVEDNLRSMEILYKLSIDAYLGIIMFEPLTTLEELAQNMHAMIDIPPYLRPWQILSKLEIYYGSPIAEIFDAKGLIKWDGFFASYDYVDSRINNVYSAIETIVKTCYAAMAKFDSLRWGNLFYSDTDQLVIDNYGSEVEQLNKDFNREILGFALEIIQKQRESDHELPISELVPGEFQEKATAINQQTLFQIDRLRKQAKIKADHV